MVEIIRDINDAANGVVWGVSGHAMKNTIGRMFQKSEAKEGSITPFQAVCTALSATAGTGNISDVAGAIALGGPGAVFWMWVSALLGLVWSISETFNGLMAIPNLIAVFLLSPVVLKLTKGYFAKRKK